MSINHVFFTSRQQAEAVTGKPDMAVISITDPGTHPAQLAPQFEHVLRLSFFDAVGGDEYIGAPLPGLFDYRMAQRIAGFIEPLKRAPDDFSVLVHCECGVSRSAAVALFVEAYTKAPLNAREFTYQANPWVVDQFLHLYPQLDIIIPPAQSAHERRHQLRD